MRSQQFHSIAHTITGTMLLVDVAGNRHYPFIFCGSKFPYLSEKEEERKYNENRLKWGFIE